MALTGNKAQPDGWRRQADYLALKHTSVATATLAAADQARRRWSSQDAECDPGLETSETDPTNEVTLSSMKRDLEQQVVPQSAVAPTLMDRWETLAARAVRVSSADKRIAELEGELAAACEALVLRENENHSLQTSLDLIGGDNSRLSNYITERDTALDEAQSQLKQIKTALAAAEAECKKLATAVQQANEKRLAEVDPVNTRLGAMTARTVTAEKLLAEAQQSLQACSEEKSSAERKLADTTAARHAAGKNIELLQNSLRVKERQVHELEHALSTLIEGAEPLQKTLKARDTALARAEEKIKKLHDTQAEAEANLAKLQRVVEQLGSQLRCERMERTEPQGASKKSLNVRTAPEGFRKAPLDGVRQKGPARTTPDLQKAPETTAPEGVRKKAPEGLRKKPHTDRTLLQRELDKDAWLLGRV